MYDYIIIFSIMFPGYRTYNLCFVIAMCFQLSKFSKVVYKELRWNLYFINIKQIVFVAVTNLTTHTRLFDLWSESWTRLSRLRMGSHMICFHGDMLIEQLPGFISTQKINNYILKISQILFDHF